MTKIDKNLDEVLSMILDMQKTYMEYFNQVNKAGD